MIRYQHSNSKRSCLMEKLLADYEHLPPASCAVFMFDVSLSFQCQIKSQIFHRQHALDLIFGFIVFLVLPRRRIPWQILNVSRHVSWVKNYSTSQLSCPSSQHPSPSAIVASFRLGWELYQDWNTALMITVTMMSTWVRMLLGWEEQYIN